MTYPIPYGSNIHRDGEYLRLTGLHDHPLSDSDGEVSYHRYILFSHLGEPEASACKWCGYWLPWKSHALHQVLHSINVDHIDGYKSNNDPENLAASCVWCNLSRNWAEKFPEFWSSWTRWMKDVPPCFRPNLLEIAKELNLVDFDFDPADWRDIQP